MSEHSAKKGTMAKDTVIYMIAKSVEGVFGVLTVSVFTYFFLPAEMGKYSAINIAITTIAMVAIQWLVQSVLRYINKYDLENEHHKFYTTVFSAWLRVNIASVVGGIMVILFISGFAHWFDGVKQFHDVYTTTILSLGVVMFVTYNTSQLIVAMLAATRRTKINLFLSVFSVVGKLLLIIFLVKTFGPRIEWIFVSYTLFDGITSLVGILTLKIYKYIDFTNTSDEILGTLKAYGIPLMGNLITTSVLNKSDIYIITGFLGESSAGIYQTNYSIVAAAFTMLATAVMRGSYPTIVRTWSEGKKELSEKLVSEAVRFYLLLALPSVIGFWVLSDVLAKVLFNASYFEGHSVMGFVALGMMFLGLTEYGIKPWELNANTKAIFYRSLIGGVFNVAINIAFVPVFGYGVAAVSTCLGFFVYFCLAKFGTRNMMKWRLPVSVYAKIFGSAALMGALLWWCKEKMTANVTHLLVFVLLGMVCYGGALYLSGEIKQEIHYIAKKLRRRQGDNE